MNLYEFNQMAMSDKQNFPIWGKEKIKDFIKEKILPAINSTKDKDETAYWLLYNKERSDVSFIIDKDKMTTNNKVNDLFNTLQNRGRIVDMTLTADGQQAYEIWIKDNNSDEVHMYILFEYSQGVIDI